MNNKVLVVEDDANISELIAYNLKENSYEVETALTGDEGFSMIQNNTYDLIVLDLMLPGINGIEICKKTRNELKINTPIIMLTAKSEEIDMLLGLELGADDYMTKPFSVRELIARIKAVLRRTSVGDSKEENDLIQVGKISISKANHEVLIDGQPLVLTLKEFELLALLAENRGKVLTRDQLLDSIWGYEYIGETRTVDVHIRYLRKKIGDEDGKIIETVRGIGYKIR